MINILNIDLKYLKQLSYKDLKIIKQNKIGIHKLKMYKFVQIFSCSYNL